MIINEDPTGNIVSTDMSDKERCRNSLVEFVKTYLSDGELDDFCSFHYDIADRLEDIVLRRKREKTYSCFVSPRGHGKSFWTSFAFPLWCIAYGHTRNILIVTSEGSLGRQFIIDIRQFIETNEKFIEDFGNLRGDVIWTTDKIACKNKVCVSTKGSEMATRGVKMFNVRPTVIICDDILSEANSSNSDQRQKLYDWYNKVLMPCGEKYCSVFVIGTILNDACLLYMMLNDAQFSDYFTKKYQAIMEFSDSPLWDEWLNMRNDLSNPNRVQDADKLYRKHRKEMLKGTKVLWDRYEDTYLFLMKEKQRIGTDAFATEYQNDGLLEESREFKEEWLTRNIYTQDELPEITDVFIGVDAAAKSKSRSDDSAIAVVGKAVNTYLYVLETFSRRVPTEDLIDQLLLYAVQYYSKIRRIAIEDVVFQILIKDIAEKRALDSGLYLPFDGIKVPNTQKKELKLRSLVIPIRNGYFKFRNDQRKLLEELRRFPKGASDNLMDALWISTVGVIGGAAINQFSFTNLSIESTRGSFGINDLIGRR
jgi:Terminase-like family.